MKQECETITIEPSSGNVFADLGCKNAEDRLAKADIAISIRNTIKERNLTQSETAKLLGIDQPSVSKLLKGQLRGFSTDRLLTFLTMLGNDVEIIITHVAKQHDQEQPLGRISVVA